MKQLREFVGAVLSKWQVHNCTRLGAALSYYTIFSLAPILIIATAVAGLIFGQEAVQGRVLAELRSMIGRDSAEMVSTMIKSAYKNDGGLLASVIGISVLLLGATGLFIQLQDALDDIWDVRKVDKEGWVGYLRRRWTSIALILAIGFLLLVSLFISATLNFLGEYSSKYLDSTSRLLESIHFIFSLAFISALFAMIYKLLPNAYIRWREVWLGALVGALLFNLGKHLIGLYLGRAAVSSAYGTAGALVIILIWSYYSAQILLFGAVISKVYSAWRGKHFPQAKPGYEIPKEAS